MPRKSEDYPEAVARDARVHGLLSLAAVAEAGMSRNKLAEVIGCTGQQIRYSLDRLRKRGQVEHIRKGNEGHGYWAVVTKETETS